VDKHTLSVIVYCSWIIGLLAVIVTTLSDIQFAQHNFFNNL
jgi:hypothetical protein